MTISRGGIVITNIPYQNNDGEFETKKRPVLVLSWRQHNLHRKDIIVAKITTIKEKKSQDRT